MTFKETDFPSLLKFLKAFLNEEPNPLLFKEVVQQMIKLYEDVPLYPGIANMCMGQVYKSIGAREVMVGQKILIQSGGDTYVGTVESKEDEGVILTGVRAINSEDELEISFKEMDKVSVINDKVLEGLWPSLVFEKGKR